MGDSEPQTQLESLRLGVVIPGDPRSLPMLRNFTERTIEHGPSPCREDLAGGICQAVQGICERGGNSYPALEFQLAATKCDMRVRIGCLGA